MTTKITLVGDSNTEYNDATFGDLAAKLQAALNDSYPAATYTITNSGVGGSTSYDALNNFSTQVTPFAPDLVVFLHGGTNDGYYNFISGNPTRYNPDAYEQRVRDYRALLDGMASYPLMLLVAAPAHAESTDGFTYHRNLTDTDPLRNRLQSLATEWGLPFVNWQTAMTVNANWKADYLVDGVHVNAAAKDVLVTGIMSALTPFLAADGAIVFPAVTYFTIPATSTTLTVPITSLLATDDVAVTGYKLTESATPPLAGDSGWSATAPETHTFAEAGIKTLWAWAKDAAGNVSAGVSDTVVITLATTTAAPTTTVAPTTTTTLVPTTTLAATTTVQPTTTTIQATTTSNPTTTTTAAPFIPFITLLAGSTKVPVQTSQNGPLRIKTSNGILSFALYSNEGAVRIKTSVGTKSLI